ncbi:MAG TPA: gamma carbonic anhydrase family protein, partial [Bacilli bacterium]|nr:gamma carbonic anhydrase family protein [Bacilli bacterium]
KKIPPNSLAFGRPAKVVRELNDEDRADMERIRREYVERGQYYKQLQEKRTIK